MSAKPTEPDHPTDPILDVSASVRFSILNVNLALMGPYMYLIALILHQPQSYMRATCSAQLTTLGCFLYMYYYKTLPVFSHFYL